MKILRRFYRMRLMTGFLVAMPGVFLCLLFASTAWKSLTKYQRWIQPDQALDTRLYQSQLYDLAQQQLKYLRPSQAIAASQAPLPHFAFQLKADRLTELLSASKHPYVQGKLRYQDTLYKKTELRLRGQKYWHLNESKKSLRVKLDPGKLIEGNQVFNLINPNDPFLIGEKLILDLARQQGLMTTETDFAEVSMNGLELGVFALTTPVDEMVLRKSRLIPANIYALEKNKAPAWKNSGMWERVAAYESSQQARPDLVRLLKKIESATAAEFAGFAQQALALREFATLDALRLLFGGDDDQDQNYALYFDLYAGKWHPIVFAFEGFRHDDLTTAQADPLFERLAEAPAYKALRTQILRELIQNRASLSQLRSQAGSLLTRLEPALAKDAQWKANKQFPALNKFYQQIMRPMSLEKLRLAMNVALEDYARRQALLSLHLQQEAPYQPQPEDKKIEEISLGPGLIQIPQTRVYQPHQQVRIQAGTQLKMGPGASLIFFGPVHFAGTQQAPILVTAASKVRWGGIALQGQASAGSRLEYLHASGGTQPVYEGYHFSGMINLHDSRNLRVIGCRLANNQGSDDLLHTIYVSNLLAQDNQIQNAASDAWDLEFSQGRIEGLETLHSGDDGIDLMGSQLLIEKTRVLDSQGNGISAGEETQIEVHNSLIADNHVGVLAKNASQVKLHKSLLWHNQTGLEINQNSEYYSGDSGIKAESLYLTQSQIELDLDKEAHKAGIEGPIFERDYRGARVLAPLQAVLGLSDWLQLPDWLNQKYQGRRLNK